MEITVRPEPFPRSHHYTIEWQFLEYDAEAGVWQSLQERRQDDEPSR